MKMDSDSSYDGVTIKDIKRCKWIFSLNSLIHQLSGDHDDDGNDAITIAK